MEALGENEMINASFWKGKRVFLTGHTGFKGSWLSIWLNELGAEVVGYALEPNTTPSLYKIANVDSLVTSVIGDIRDLPLLKKTMVEFNPDIVIHMAAQSLVRESYDTPVDTYEINVMGTVNVLESVRHCDSVKAVLNVTTDKVYENKEWTWGYRESDTLGGYDPYSNSKACSELVTSSYIQSFFNPKDYGKHGVAIATARAGNVIGGGDWAKDRLIPDIIRAIEHNENITLRNPNAVRPWQHVLEPLSGYLMLVEKLFINGTEYGNGWNFGPSSNNIRNVKDVVDLILIYFGEYSGNVIIEDNTLHETQLLQLESSKANKLLKWNSKWGLEKTLENVVNAYQKDCDLVICKKQIDLYMNKE